MKRRNFLKSSLAATVLPMVLPGCGSEGKISGKIVGASVSIGHLLRDRKFDEPTIVERKRVVIVGGGVSGLSAARHLVKNGISDFAILDLEKNAGGNAAHGSNDTSSFPWGAHYVPTPNNDLTEYIEFLKEHEVITGFNETGLPVYNEYYLCFDPQDRLYINGRWQEGLVPNFGVEDGDKKQIARFLRMMDEFKGAAGQDGKQAFAIPVDNSSLDKTYTDLDKQTMKEWLIANGFDSTYLHWYVNYCTRDDFGTPFHQVSAWAGIHYFASRKGKGANAEDHDVLTWPEGNGFLINALCREFGQQIKTNALATRVRVTGTGAIVDYFDVITKTLKRIEAEQCIMAVPQFIAMRLLNEEKRIALVGGHYNYMPWMVANMKVKKLEERSGAPLSWDNVLYDSESLGYVEATHELLEQNIPYKNLTYYLPLTAGGVVDERRAAQQKAHEEWVKIVVDDLRKVHPNIDSAIVEMNVMVWGHAMVQPLPGMIHGSVRKELSASISDVVHFAHTDLAGISIFEEGFYQGLKAAKLVLNKLS